MFKVHSITIWLMVGPLETVSSTGQSWSHSVKQYHPSWAEDQWKHDADIAVSHWNLGLSFSLFQTESLQWDLTNPAPSLEPPSPSVGHAAALSFQQSLLTRQALWFVPRASTPPHCARGPHHPLLGSHTSGEVIIAPTSCWWLETLSSHLGKTLWDCKAEPPCAVTYSSCCYCCCC